MAGHVIFHGYDGYTTNVPLAEQMGMDAMIATRYNGVPIEAEHGGPARLLVPHLYFWKSAKWIAEFRFVELFPVVAGDPAAVVERDAREIETERCDQPKILRHHAVGRRGGADVEFVE